MAKQHKEQKKAEDKKIYNDISQNFRKLYYEDLEKSDKKDVKSSKKKKRNKKKWVKNDEEKY